MKNIFWNDSVFTPISQNFKYQANIYCPILL